MFATEEVAKDSTQVFDPSILNALPMVADGSAPGFADMLLDLFCQSANKTLDALKQVAPDEAATTLTRSVHTFKSSALQVGAVALAREAKWQEDALRSGEPMQADWPERLVYEFERFERALALHRAARDPGEGDIK